MCWSLLSASEACLRMKDLAIERKRLMEDVVGC